MRILEERHADGLVRLVLDSRHSARRTECQVMYCCEEALGAVRASVSANPNWLRVRSALRKVAMEHPQWLIAHSLSTQDVKFGAQGAEN